MPEYTIDACGRWWVRAAGRRVGLVRGFPLEIQVERSAGREIVTEPGALIGVILLQGMGVEEALVALDRAIKILCYQLVPSRDPR